MNKKFMNKYLKLALGVTLSTLSIVTVLRPNGLMTGGITGLSRIMEAAFSNKTNIDSNMIFNISYYGFSLLILALAFIFLGKKDGMRIIVMTFVYPTLLLLFTFLDLPEVSVTLPVEHGGVVVGQIRDTLVPAVMYGVLAGTGSGLVVRSGFTSGGSDTIAKILYRRVLPFLSIGVIMLIVDSLVILSSIFFFEIHIVAYAFISKFVYMKFVDIVVFGFGNNWVKIEIISQEYPSIQEYIIQHLHRGVTIYDAEGGYHHLKGKQIMCICTPKESLRLKTFIASVDPNAFVSITKIDSIWGRGFKSIVLDDLS